MNTGNDASTTILFNTTLFSAFNVIGFSPTPFQKISRPALINSKYLYEQNRNRTIKRKSETPIIDWRN